MAIYYLSYSSVSTTPCGCCACTANSTISHNTVFLLHKVLNIKSCCSTIKIFMAWQKPCVPLPAAVPIYTKQATPIRDRKSSHSSTMQFGRVWHTPFCVCRSIPSERSTDICYKRASYVDAFTSSLKTYPFNMAYPTNH